MATKCRSIRCTELFTVTHPYIGMLVENVHGLHDYVKEMLATHVKRGLVGRRVGSITNSLQKNVCKKLPHRSACLPESGHYNKFRS